MLAATEHLHRRIARMGDRIRQLEGALAVLQTQNSDEPHPLLHESLVQGAQDTSGDDMSVITEDTKQQQKTREVLDAFGTLSISDHGISRFFGPTGGSEVGLDFNLLLKRILTLHIVIVTRMSENTGSLRLLAYSDHFLSHKLRRAATVIPRGRPSQRKAVL